MTDDIPPGLLKTARRAWSYDREISVQRIARLLLAEREAYAAQKVRKDRGQAAALFRTIANGCGPSTRAAVLRVCADDLEAGEHDKQAD